ncbi:uncharacterized protein LOC127250066 [Andrographis paniculata]|uniref:uncharacterized protein LOC127250066 n=1 Tax=Andrographis paniculata TaxID=175694 RepID=UPI0021E97EF4|nr:uncharacterized protein LOC127250066 [Andrographis paniculata]
METEVSANGVHNPIPPCGSGEGHPYAPVDWPNPGDIWTWKVGNKINPAGYYTHRSLIVPKRLQKTPTRKIWLGSKDAVIRFLNSEFPDADVNAFFASFTWDIPGGKGAAPIVKKEASAEKPVAAKKATSVKKEISVPTTIAPTGNTPARKSTPRKQSTPRKTSTPPNHEPEPIQTRKRTRNSEISNKEPIPKVEAESGSQVAKRTRNSANSNQGSIPKTDGETENPFVRRTRNSTRKLLSNEDRAISTDLVLTEGVSTGHLTSVTEISPVKNANGQSGSRRKRQDSNSQMNHITEMSSEDFDNYLNSLDDILYQSVPEAPTLDSSLLETEVDFARVREELSSLLSHDLSSLFSSNKLPLVTSLSSKLRSDPDLTLEELSMLDLILEIPDVSNHFLSAKQVKSEASKFFADLETNIALVSKLKSKYTLSKDKIAVLQAEIAYSPTIQEIDEQISKLQARRDVLAKAVEENEAQIEELTATQKRILNSLPKIVNEVKTANLEKSEWEVKQKEAAKQEAQILEKFAPLEGYTFVH